MLLVHVVGWVDVTLIGFTAYVSERNAVPQPPTTYQTPSLLLPTAPAITQSLITWLTGCSTFETLCKQQHGN
jgi:hypothetical protein